MPCADDCRDDSPNWDIFPAGLRRLVAQGAGGAVELDAVDAVGDGRAAVQVVVAQADVAVAGHHIHKQGTVDVVRGAVIVHAVPFAFQGTRNLTDGSH